MEFTITEYGGDSLLAIEVLSEAARKGLVLGFAAQLSADFEVFSLFAFPVQKYTY